MKKWFPLILCLCCLAASGQNDTLFRQAIEEYNKGEYEAAAGKYLEILDNGQHSAALYFNLGNCYYKLDEIAPSVYYYEKALLLKPNDPEILDNLNYARNMTLDDIEVIPETGFARLTGRVTGLLSFDQWAYAAVALIVLFVLAYIAYYYLRYSSHKRLAFIFSMICLIMSVMALSMAFIQYDAFKNEQPAIVFATETRVMSEPNTRSSEAFVLHEGTKVQVLDQLNDWKKIRLADGSSGWIAGKDIKLLKDF